MKLKNVTIENYKSIKKLKLPFKNYGEDLSKSNTTFLVGINESGKSTILEAISLLLEGFKKSKYDEVCWLPAQESNESVNISYEFDFDFNQYWQIKIIDLCNIPEQLANKIICKRVIKNITLDNQIYTSKYIVELNDSDYSNYIVQKKVFKNISGKLISVDNIIPRSNLPNSTESTINGLNIKFSKEKPQIITKEYLETIITTKLTTILDQNLPTLVIWKPNPGHLINTTISLREFKENTSISIPLRNIFHIYGKTSDSDIKEAIERALSSQARKDELVDKISTTTTNYINKIWKEHQIKLRISINSDLCEVFVEDKDKNHTYYKMNQRSDGFKQFISLILSLSALNQTNKLSSNIILIDEPEIHLHPSGIRYMRDELLKIGITNSVLVSTHSQYMVDTSCPERHWIVSKMKSETTVEQISDETPIEDDKVLSSAFGLSLFKELLPANIIVVEGGDDKSVIAHAIRLIKLKFFHSIKTAKGASKAYGIAALLNEENIPAFFLFDDDKEGKDHKKKIIDSFKESFNSNNVFTLRDILSSLPLDSTLEDLMPISFVKDFFDSELNFAFNLVDSKPIIIQLKQQNQNLKIDKQKLDSLKVKLAKKFISEFNTKSRIEDDAKRLFTLINTFVEKIDK